LQYLITFLEGIISFISPCILPMLPVYISYFVAGDHNKKSILKMALFFVLGFTLVFTVFGIFAGTLGSFFIKYERVLHIICGGIIVILGLNHLDIIRIPFFKSAHISPKVTGVFTSFLFGVVFSVSHIPCVGALLGSALAQAAHTGSAFFGMLLLIVYSLGMGIPFLIFAVLMEKLSSVFDFVNKNYKTINVVCGLLLIALGIAMMTGFLHNLICSH